LVGTTLIDGMPVSSDSTGTASASSTTTVVAPSAHGRRQSRSPQAAKRGLRCSPWCTHGSASLSTRAPSRPSTAGSSVSVAASTKTTDSMIPAAIERNAGLFTSITALSETSTVRPLSSTALPAVSIVSSTASTGSRPDPNNAPRNRWTTNRA
jgi:hypothetical protein